MVIIENVTKHFGAHPILVEANWRIPTDDVVGLVGPNGAGKSTLLRIILGEIEPDRGDVVIPRGCTVGYLPQEVEAADTGATLLEVILSGRDDLLQMEGELRRLEKRMGEGGTEEEAAEYGRLRERFDHAGGYSLEGRAREIATGIGFDEDDFDAQMSSFSGGWRMRALLARLLLRRPDILLLDEPTNHLDLESLEWLERFLNRYDGAVVVVSHDRYFLNRMVGEIVELERGTLTSYHGNYDYYREKKAEERERLAAAAARQEKEIERIQRFIERFRYKASKASQVQSRVKMLEKMDRIDVPDEEEDPIAFEFPQPPRVGKIVLDAHEISKAYGDNVVYDGIDLTVYRGDRVALVGPNGAGKSTLLKLFAGVIPQDDGEVRIGHNVEVAYFAQHAVDQLDPTRSILEEMRDEASFEAQPSVRSILGAFGFSGDDVDKPISVLSGGEKSRLALAKLMLEPAGCLLLDEPTNHLDIASRQVLEFALQQFEGAFAVVSHDRYFINEVANKVVHVENGGITVYPGDYDYYKFKRAEGEERRAKERNSGEREEEASDPALSRKERRRAAAEIRKKKRAATRKLKRRIDTVEERIDDIEARRAEIEGELAKPGAYDDTERAKSLNQEYDSLEDELLEKMTEWEELASELDQIESRYDAEVDAL